MKFKLSTALTFALALTSTILFSQSYDIVLKGGRVIDPETGLDATRNLGISNGRIVEISSDNLNGREVIDVSGLVVAPGFIDLHVHGMTNVEQEYQVKDGVTTALELEGGIPFLQEWYQSRKGQALINYGASVNWGSARMLAMEKNAQLNQKLEQLSTLEEKRSAFFAEFGSSPYTALKKEEIPSMISIIEKELYAGGIGIGLPIGYYPGAKPEEDYRLYQFSGKQQVPIFTHVRQGGTIAIQQSISNAVTTGAPLHIVHINSMSLGDIEIAIEMVQSVQKQGYPITTELYPYTAASTSLESALFDEGWQEAFGISYGDLQWQETGERLTEKTFNEYRKKGGIVIIHMMKPEWIAAGLKSQGTLVASDGMPYAKLAHPRTAGTFSRVLGKYVREDKVLSLNEAISKMTLLPARVLENFVPVMKNKGRIQVGADADITIFDPETIVDRATFEGGLEFSTGVEYVIVDGKKVLEGGELVNNAFPGQPIMGQYKR